MKRMLLSNHERCTGCQLCEQICSLAHTKTSNPERSRIRILKIEEKGINIQTFCQRCEDAACVSACPVSAIRKSEGSGVIEIDHETCIKCEDCIAACPYRSMHFDRTEEKVITCDLCGGDPQCVMFCQTKAIEFAEEGPDTLKRREEGARDLARLLKLFDDH